MVGVFVRCCQLHSVTERSRNAEASRSARMNSYVLNALHKISYETGTMYILPPFIFFKNNTHHLPLVDCIVDKNSLASSVISLRAITLYDSIVSNTPTGLLFFRCCFLCKKEFG